MSETYDVIIAGLGAMGSSVAMHAAKRGLKVLGLDRYTSPHPEGSTHGHTRLIREAYYEHPLYVPMVRRAYELWHELEAEVGVPLLRRTGSIMVGRPDAELVRGALRSATEHGVPHSVLSAVDISRQYPAFNPLDDMVGVHEPGSSLLNPEQIVAAQLSQAAVEKATVVMNSRVLSFMCSTSGVIVTTESGSYSGRKLVLAAGAWNGQIAPEAFGMLQVERQLQQWWAPASDPEFFHGHRMPVTMWQLGDDRIFYTMPDLGDGVKLGWHHNGIDVDPDAVDRTAGARENAELSDLLRRFLPNAKGSRLRSAVCFYTNTPDGHFLIDRHPDHAPVLLLSACSGHGFKFASVIGEMVTDLLLERTPRFDLTPFHHARFTE